MGFVPIPIYKKKMPVLSRWAWFKPGRLVLFDTEVYCICSKMPPPGNISWYLLGGMFRGGREKRKFYKKKEERHKIKGAHKLRLWNKCKEAKKIKLKESLRNKLWCMSGGEKYSLKRAGGVKNKFLDRLQTRCIDI